MAQTTLAPARTRGGLMRPDFGLFGSLQREIDRLLEDFARGPGGTQAPVHLVPNIDVTETDNMIEVTAELPGLERGDVEVSLDNDTLTIRGEKRIEDAQDDRNVRLSERSYGVFLRVLQLPSGIDPSSVQATMANGILRIKIPKSAGSQGSKIEVREEEAQQAQQTAPNSQQDSKQAA
jgi:HSP20 family protein